MPSLFDIERNGEYSFQTFKSRMPMYRFMEKIRASSPFEASGYVESIGQRRQLRFFYRLGNDIGAVDMDNDVSISWHTHTDDLGTRDIQVRQAEMTLRPREKDLVEPYQAIDEEAAEKMSLIDLIGYLEFQREEDLVSIPNRKLIQVRVKEASATSPIAVLGQQLRDHKDQLFRELIWRPFNRTGKLPDLTEVSIETAARQVRFAIDKFGELLIQRGVSRMTTENYQAVLTDLGLPLRVVKF